MNLEAITLPSEIGGDRRAAEGTENAFGNGDFSSALRGAMGEEASTESAPDHSDSSRDAEQDASKQFTESDSPAEQGDDERNAAADDASAASAASDESAEGNADADRLQAEANAREESTAEERTAESAHAAADTGAVGDLLSGRQMAAREGTGLSEREESQGTASALDTNRQQTAGLRPTLSGEDDTAVSAQVKGATTRGSDSQVSIDAIAAPASETAERDARVAPELGDAPEARAASRATESQRSATGVASQATQAAQAAQTSQAAEVEAEAMAGARAGAETDSPERAAEGKSERAAAIAAAPTTPVEGAVSREDEASVRSDTGAGGEGTSQGERDGSNASRDFSEQQTAAEQQGPSLADAEAQAGVAAEAAAAYSATATSGTVLAEEAVSVESGISVAGPVAVTAPETASAPTAPTANAPQPAAASDAIAVQTEWLATRGGGSARLRLNPAELGEIEIRVTVRGGVVEVVMVAQEAVTQALAEEQSERLAQAFANRDLRMDGFDVRRGDPNAPSNDANGDFARSSQQGEDRNAQDDQTGGGRGSVAAGQVGGGAAPSAPVMPQILATGPEASVDLRI